MANLCDSILELAGTYEGYARALRQEQAELSTYAATDADEWRALTRGHRAEVLETVAKELRAALDGTPTAEVGHG